MPTLSCLPDFERKFQLGADAVGAGYQHRIMVFFRDFKQRPKPANAGEHFRAHGTFGVGLDVFYQAIARVDVHSCRAVGKGCGVRVFLFG